MSAGGQVPQRPQGHIEWRLVETLAVFTAAFAYFGLLAGYGYNVADEGAVIEQIERLADGERIYHDFHIGYTPGFYYLHALMMRVFGHSVMPIRWLLALVNAASVALAFSLASVVSRRIWCGIAAAILCLGVFPVHPADFSMSNTPYPTWYNMAIWLAGALVLLPFFAKPSVARLTLAGALAGLAFTFKPNVGLFQLAATSMIVLSALPMRRDGETGPLSPSALVWWAWWVGIVAGVVVVLSGGAGPREYIIFVAPVMGAAVLVARYAMRLPVDARMPHPFMAAAAVVGPFVAINAPWLLYYCIDLGVPTFLKRVLFYNSGYEASYFVNHLPVALPLTIVFAVMAALRFAPAVLTRRGIAPDRVLAVVFPLSVAALIAATQLRAMPEGFVRAMNMPFEFFAPGVTVAFHWLGLATWIGMASDDESDRSSQYAFGVVLIAAVFLYLQMYPRADFGHWVGAMAASGCLAAAVTARVLRHWRGEHPTARKTPEVLGAMAALFILCLFPAVRAVHVLSVTLEPGALGRNVVRSQSTKVPVWSNAGASSWYADVDALSGFVQSHTEPDEKVFYFPALGTISFMGDRRNPTRHVYFFPGWPGREVEAEVIAWLRRSPPPLVVIGQYPQLYFSNAHAYYHVLKQYLEREYQPVARLGRFLVLGRHGDERFADGPVRTIMTFEESGPPDSVRILREGLASPDPAVRLHAVDQAGRWYVRSYSQLLIEALDDPDEAVRNSAVWALHRTRSSAVGCALLEGALESRFSARAYTLALRLGSLNVDDESCLDVILAMEASTDSFVRNTSIIAIATLLSRTRVEEHWIGGRFGLPDSVDRVPVSIERIEHFLRAPELNPVLRDLAVYLAGRSDDVRAEALLLEASRDLELPRLRVNAMWKLVEKGQGEKVLDRALEHLGIGVAMAPAVVHKAIEQTADGPARLAEFIRTASGEARTAALWVAAALEGGTQPQELADVAQVLADALDSPIALERAAAAWSLGNVADPHPQRSEVRAVLSRMSNDEDPLVAEMAAYGLESFGARVVAGD